MTMADERHDPEFLKHLFEATQVLRKPIGGIIALTSPDTIATGIVGKRSRM